jgi:hypothetical protein
MDVPTPTGAILSLVKACFKHSSHLGPLSRSYRYLFRKKIRVSMACLARYEIDGKVILVKNRHRPEFIAPFGGVIKFYNDARVVLDKIEFKPEDKASKDPDLSDDLRGFFDAKHFGTFMTWFKSRTAREQGEALRRELTEELAEAGVPEEIAAPLINARYSLIREVHEGPYGHDDLKYASFRYFDIYRPDMTHEVEIALKALVELSSVPGAHIYCVSRQELDNFRTQSGQSIAGNSRYLNSSKWHGFEPAAI